MTRRLEAGPLLVTLGALLLLVSLFLAWYTNDISAWEAFEVWDVVLFVLALASIAAGLGLTTQEVELVDRRILPIAVLVVTIVVVSQMIDPPPAATGEDPEVGWWIAMGGALLMVVGAVLTFGKVHLALTVEGRDQRRHVSAVDARGPADPTTEAHEPVTSERRRLFARDRTPGATEETTPMSNPGGGKASPEQKQD
jgi:hypothetical protein